jgi:hypothetical protein
MLQSPRLEMLRELGDGMNTLGDRETGCWLDEVKGVAAGGILDRVVLEWTQKLQTVVEFEVVTKDLRDFQIVGAD